MKNPSNIMKHQSFKTHIFNSLLMAVVGLSMMGCAATQPVKWNTQQALDYNHGSQLSLDATCEVPKEEMEFMEDDIQKHMNDILSGTEGTPDQYTVNVTITKYNKGNAFARGMLIGLGSMHLYGNVEVTEGNPPVVVREGQFKKVYALGGVIGASATMRNNVAAKLGKSIGDALEEGRSDQE